MAGEIELIAKIKPYNDAFRGMMDADQLVGTAGSFGVHIIGSAIGYKGYKYFPFACTITGWTFVANAVGSIVVDLKKCAVGDLPTTVSITAAAKPTISSARASSDDTLAGWTTTIAAGDVVEFYVDSIDTITNATLDIKYERAI